MFKKKCKKCGVEFSTYYDRQKYCSYDCAYKDRILENKICPICWSKFHPIRQKQVCCSKGCAAKRRAVLPDLKCLFCWKLFHSQYKWQRFCSISCGKKYQRKNMPAELQDEQLWRMIAWNKSMTSQINIDYAEYLKWLWYPVDKLDFKLGWKYFDIKIWNTLIEINPFAYHNTTWHPYNKQISKTKHKDKMQLAVDNWYRCITIRDWDDKTKIPYLIDEKKKKIWARECEIKELKYEEYNSFINDNHLQWNTTKNKKDVCVWLYYNSLLVECMLFGKPRYNKKYEREILRLCSHKDYIVVWGANKIFKHFLQMTWANSCISYCDLSKFSWWVYSELWFKLKKENPPAKHWYNWRTGQHITDNLLRERWFDQLFWTNYWKWTDNEALMLDNWFVEIYDCWQLTFIFNK